MNMRFLFNAIRTTQRHRLPLFMGVLLVLTGPGQSRAEAQTPADSVDLFIATKMRQLRIPGLQLAVVRHGQVVKLG